MDMVIDPDGNWQGRRSSPPRNAAGDPINQIIMQERVSSRISLAMAGMVMQMSATRVSLWERGLDQWPWDQVYRYRDTILHIRQYGDDRVHQYRVEQDRRASRYR